MLVLVTFMCSVQQAGLILGGLLCQQDGLGAVGRVSSRKIPARHFPHPLI